MNEPDSFRDGAACRGKILKSEKRATISGCPIPECPQGEDIALFQLNGSTLLPAAIAATIFKYGTKIAA